MTSKPLKTAILGLSNSAAELIDAAAKCDRLDIIAVADRDQDLTKRYAAQFNAADFDDYRQLIVQNDLDLLIVTEPAHISDEHVHTAIANRVNVIATAPAVLDFERAAEIRAKAKKAKVKFIVANDWRFMPAYSGLFEYLREFGNDQFHLITAMCNEPRPVDDMRDRWLSDPELAGGGVVMHNCYQVIDQIVRNFGLPQRVFSVSTNHAPDMQQRLSITEDTAILTMKFSDTLTGNVITSRTLGPNDTYIRLHGKEKTVTVTHESFTIADNLGDVIDCCKYTQDREKRLLKMLDSVSKAINGDSQASELIEMPDFLDTMAVIESAYLSAKTASPEAPVRMLKMVNVETAMFAFTSGKESVDKTAKK